MTTSNERLFGNRLVTKQIYGGFLLAIDYVRRVSDYPADYRVLGRFVKRFSGNEKHALRKFDMLHNGQIVLRISNKIYNK